MDEKLLRQIASEYVRQDGEQLRRELNELPQSDARQDTPSLDRRVFGRIDAIKQVRSRRFTGILAACAALALLARFTLFAPPDVSVPPDSMSTISPSISAMPSTSATPEYAIIPLSFTLPERFSVSDVEQDIEKTVYYIEDAALDDIVMTLQYADDLTLFRELTPVAIGAYTAYGAVEEGYSLLAFEHDGILYILTCEHDLNTLIELSKNILI